MHAYLVIANKNIEQLRVLLNLLDNVNNDIYLTVDAKSDIVEDAHKLTTKYSKLVLFDNISIYWGEFSQVQAEMQMIELAARDHYQYYHIISGIDLPLQPQSVIKRFFDQNPNKEFLTFAGTIPQSIIRRRKFPRIFRHHYRPESGYKWKLIHLLQRVWLAFQILIHLSPNHKKEFIASNWCSIDDHLAQILVLDKEKIVKRFSKGYLVDEAFIPWIVDQHNLWSRIYYSKPMHNQESDFQGNLRYINWWDGEINPKIFKNVDLDIAELKRARRRGYLFARKFDDHVDSKIIEKVVKWVEEGD